ncbi:MAG: exodeoxyribonuclease VII small subunit [Burkholderiaceae bacterium]|nr:exodeoxyribonuclease VII small subunit [Burkholderiaceae bacterium]
MVKSSSRQPGDAAAEAAGAEGASAAPGGASAAPVASPDGPAPESFELALGELERIVQRMESGTLSLEQSLADYRRGAALIGWCRKSLSEVQQQVRILEADLLRPFEPDDAEES